MDPNATLPIVAIFWLFPEGPPFWISWGLVRSPILAPPKARFWQVSIIEHNRACSWILFSVVLVDSRSWLSLSLSPYQDNILFLMLFCTFLGFWQILVMTWHDWQQNCLRSSIFQTAPKALTQQQRGTRPPSQCYKHVSIRAPRAICEIFCKDPAFCGAPAPNRFDVWENCLGVSFHLKNTFGKTGGRVGSNLA